MNMIFTCWLLQMLKCSHKHYTQGGFPFFFLSFSPFLKIFIFQIQKDWTVHMLGLVFTEQVIYTWKHCICLVPQLMSSVLSHFA